MPGHRFPLTEAQEGLWYAQALDPANPILNTGQYLEITGPLDMDAFRRAVDLTLAESEALRLRFSTTQPLQWLGDPPALTVTTCTEAEAHAAMRADTMRPLALEDEPAAAFTLFAVGEGRHLLYQRIHHLAVDGYGMVLVTNRIGEHYSGIPAPFPPLSRATEEDQDYRLSEKRTTDAAFWHQTLADLPEVSGPAPGRAVSGHDFLRESRWLPQPLLDRLTTFAAAQRLTWPDVLTAITAAYLARWTGGEAVVGVPFMARMGSRASRVPCMTMNVLPLRVTPDEDAPLSEWLRTVAKDLAQGRRHGRYRSEQMRRDLGLIGGAKRLHGPLINVQPFDLPPKFAGLDVRLHILGAGAVDDLTLTFRGDAKTGLLFEVDANPTLYSGEDVHAHSLRLEHFLTAVLAGESLDVPTAIPGEVPVQDTAHPIPDTTLTALIEAQMAATPDAVAIRFGDRAMTYADLDRESAALAAKLAARGAGPDKIVAVNMDRSLDLPVALVAILRSGAAYLPLDPDHPPDRIARILAQANPVAVLPCDLDGDAPMTAPAPGDMAYVIFTSGSTGDPKGVVIEHRAIVNRLLWMRDHYGIDATDRILQKTPATFDVSVWEFFLPLICGAELVIAPPGAHRDPAAIAALIRGHRITTVHFVPSMLSAFLASPASVGLSPKRVFCSGEELTADQRARFHRQIRAELHNLYGPTEAAVDVSYWPAAPDDTSNPLPIGFPVWNTTLHVLDERMRPVPPGLAGHLYLGGVQLARGYLGRPDLTAERFTNGLYVTGDLARLRHDGAVVFLGRSDHQVKIRGLRIELGEVEAAIMATGLARECVVLARQDRLVAYVVKAAEYDGPLAARLTTLPAYMIPAAEVVLDALPVTANGKLDRKALPDPAFAATGRAPETPTERLLSRLFAEALRLDAPPPADADFFALGGDSLAAVHLALGIEQETGRDPGLGTVFEHPILSQLAAALDAGRPADDGLGPAILLAQGDTARAPLFLIHPAGGLCWGYRGLARQIAPERQVWGLQNPGLDPDIALPESLDALAAGYADRVAAMTDGPVLLAGWSVGGIIAQAMAVRLEQMGRRVALVAMLDSYPTDCWRNEPEPDPVAALRALLAIAGHDPEAHRDLTTRDAVVDFLRQGETALGQLPDKVLDGVIRTVTDTNRLVRTHWHRPMTAPLLHFRAALDHADRDLHPAMWQPWAQVTVIDLPHLHSQMTSAAATALIGPALASALRET
ncbi:non-ribosomal peptide synthetase [Falsirhodobacter xinxiangensis]|uniref:non-ribosomal peptide synthetase n=1 Tax=Falsirhodobacter xinxiangensis TaxID=2530049 RepID=UPI0010AB27BC|nr:non-ribosomal peptide synthetase [Rhodobacter xinxiangensis]